MEGLIRSLVVDFFRRLDIKHKVGVIAIFDFGYVISRFNNCQ